VAPGPPRRASENPYSKLAVDILETTREHELAMSSSIVAYLKMLVTLGTLRFELALDYDLQSTVRSFIRRLGRQQVLQLLDPRRSFDRLYLATGRVQRAIEFMEFLESQQPVISEATSSLFGFRRRVRSARRRLISLGVSVLIVGAVLYVVLAFPTEVRGALPREMPYTWVQLGLLILLILLIVGLINYIRGLGREDD
ncbi:MAG TPA: hypothetical protein VH440_09500, partial [Candidatus Limnocylindrales bacterium]